VKHLNSHYVSSNKQGQNVTYNYRDRSNEQDTSQIQDLAFHKDTKLKENMHNYPSSKNHRSMLKLHEKRLKKVSNIFERDKSATSIGMKNHKFNVDKTAQLLNKYNKTSMAKIVEVPNTESSDFMVAMQSKAKASKSSSRYDNEVLSSNEKIENMYKRNPGKANSRLGDYSAGVKQSKESDIIKSLVKDDFNPFVFNAFGDIKPSQEHSERVINNKIFSRIAHHVSDMQNDKSNTMEMKEQLQAINNSNKFDRKKNSDHSHLKVSGKYTKNSTPNVDQRRNELDVI